MYTKHFGLTSLPFENSPDPWYFFNHGRHAEVLDLMQDFVSASRGLLVVAGPIGTGKSTLSQMLVRSLPKDIKLIWLVEPPTTARDLVLFVAQELGVPFSRDKRLFIIRDLVNRLVELRAQGKRTLIILDEAHLMSPEVLEGVRIMNNFEKGADKLVHVVLIGQDELLGTLEAPAMRPLRQRISTIINLGLMSPPMVRAYIEHRLELAGGPKDLMSPLAVDTVAHVSGGAPRLVNSLCNIALRNAFIKRAATVDYEEVFRAAEELGYGTEALHHLIKASTVDQLETLKEVDLEAWASRIREEVALEKGVSQTMPATADGTADTSDGTTVTTGAAAVTTGAAAVTTGAAAVTTGAAASSSQAARLTIRVPSSTVNATPAAPRPVPAATHAERPRRWVAPLLLLAASLATLGVSVYYYGPKLGLDVTHHITELKKLVSLLHL